MPWVPSSTHPKGATKCFQPTSTIPNHTLLSSFDTLISDHIKLIKTMYTILCASWPSILFAIHKILTISERPWQEAATKSTAGHSFILNCQGYGDCIRVPNLHLPQHVNPTVQQRNKLLQVTSQDVSIFRCKTNNSRWTMNPQFVIPTNKLQRPLITILANESTSIILPYLCTADKQTTTEKKVA